MENIEYKNSLVEIISEIKDRATYLKTLDATDKDFNDKHFEGMALAYYYVMDGIKNYIECDEDMELEDFGLEDYDPSEILNYKPLTEPTKE
jgi:hypothetical protein